jgi:hypothetical protein
MDNRAASADLLACKEFDRAWKQLKMASVTYKYNTDAELIEVCIP